MSSRTIRGPLNFSSTTVYTGTGNVTVVNESVYVVKKASGAATQVTLPASPQTGRAVLVIDGKGDAATNNVTVVAASGNIIAAASYVLSENYAAALFLYNGSEWDVAASFRAVGSAELAFLDGVTAGTGLASKALVLDSSGNLTMPAAPAGIDERNAEVVTATNVIAASENGRTYYLSSATEFVSTLPAPALGLRYTFIVAAAPSGASYTVVTSGSSNIIKGNQNSVAGDAGDFGTADDTITFVDGQSVAGDKVEVFSDGTSWFAYAISKVAAGITFTQAS